MQTILNHANKKRVMRVTVIGVSTTQCTMTRDQFVTELACAGGILVDPFVKAIDTGIDPFTVDGPSLCISEKKFADRLVGKTIELHGVSQVGECLIPNRVVDVAEASRQGDLFTS